ncbi:LLM class flavin-dependent oxidoreductase [Lentibacillus sp. CBA3610]|uniref:LLM class flavin-dependent oxidoreductase n=1 Tax=Lentibacillus sp. CBA3610 TaxID=2518176 RepID=UPI001594EBBA|nr:LLM class flavin-dependent oxidoreductase [Lentibacillus sp. CBA3610]QKY69847.1 LLM class flavin-dependent oxidoreductase [Lentibacillus sp. CBA3610]
MKLSILDQSPISTGKTPRDALNASVDLARLGDELGYTRYWIAEHHDFSGLACPNPDVMLGMIGSRTERIRIGAGAVLLPHYTPFRVAETYNLLATLYSGRIDLGIGRAPGGSAEASIALSGDFLENVRQMPDKLDELLRFFRHNFAEDDMYAKISPTPIPEFSPQPWMLGTSEKSAIAAAENGLPYTFGKFMSDQDGPSIIKTYNEKFAEKYPDRSPKIIMTVSVICAETTEEAWDLATSTGLWSIQRDKGEGDGKVPTVSEAKNYAYSDEEKEKIQGMRQNLIVGNPKEVKQQLEQLQAVYHVDEWMLVTITHSYEARKKSYELLAKEILSDS